jgi:hypothetical protein
MNWYHLIRNPFDFEFISPYDVEIEWEEHEATEHYLNLCKIAEDSDEVVFDDFYMYEKYE